MINPLSFSIADSVGSPTVFYVQTGQIRVWRENQIASSPIALAENFLRVRHRSATVAVAVGGTTLAIATLVGDSLSLAPKQSPSTSPFLDVAIGPSNSYYACTANAVFEFSMTGGWTKLPDVDVVGCRGLFYSESGNLYLAGPRGARRWCAVAVREWRMAVDRTASGER